MCIESASGYLYSSVPVRTMSMSNGPEGDPPAAISTTAAGLLSVMDSPTKDE